MIKNKNYFSISIFFISCLYIAGCAPYPRFTTVDTEKNSVEEKLEDNIIVETRIESVPGDETNPDFDHHGMMEIVNKRIGVPYKYGGKNESGFDCSGFTSYVYDKALRIKLSPYSVDQYKVGKKMDRDNLKFGDLVFFNTTGRIPSHVGIYIGDDRFAHASVQKGVTISSLSSKYYKNRFLGGRRVVFR